MNIDFSARPGFSFYVLLLIASGLVMVAVGSPAVRRQTTLQRVLNVAFGLGFLGYGIYLAFLFNGGHYVIFFQAFILPILLISRTIRGSKAAPTPYPPTAYAQPVAPAQPSAPAQPTPYPPAVTSFEAPSAGEPAPPSHG